MGRNDQIADDLRRIGVGCGDVLMVHASLRAVGALSPGRAGGVVEGGADGLLDALFELIGGDGTLFMNIGADDDWHWVNERPPEVRPLLLANAEPFDARTTPAEAENGVLAEVFRCRSGTVVSNHPEGRFAANGPLAERLLRDVPWDDYYGVDSPLDRSFAPAARCSVSAPTPIRSHSSTSPRTSSSSLGNGGSCGIGE